MTPAQRVALRISEVRSRLNEISGLGDDEFSDEVRAESDKLQGEYKDLESRHRSALIAEAGKSSAPKRNSTATMPRAPNSGPWLPVPVSARSSRPRWNTGRPLARRPSFRPSSV